MGTSQMADPSVNPSEAGTIYPPLINVQSITDPITGVNRFYTPVDVTVPIASSALSGTVGNSGAAYELQDGPDRGAKLVWAIPEGGLAHKWCWWLWPQSEYEGY